jgi:TRAP transporter 4TM/12TM fusion protein
VSGAARAVAAALFWLVATLFAATLLGYYLTGAGGPMRLAVLLVPLAVALVTLNDARAGGLYPRLPPWAQLGAALVTTGMALASSGYLLWQFDAIRIDRVGIWSAADYLAGGAAAVLVLEYTRRKYLALFIVTLVLVAYAVYGQFVPGLFRHAGLPWSRVLSAASLEMSTGVFDRLAQLGLTLIGAFILVLAVLRAFGAIESILHAASRLAVHRPALLPQAAVGGSFAIAAVSGSGAANAATTGAATIPALIRAGFPRVQAAAVETAASLGGQLMPPLMGVAAFLMAELMGVSYFDVVARGFAPALIYFAGVAFAVWWLARRYPPRSAPDAPPMQVADWLRLTAYGLTIVGLVVLMGVQRQAAMNAALQVFAALLAGLGVLHLQAWWRGGERRWRALFAPFARLVDTFALTTAELTVLLATLGMLTAAFTITGVPDKVGVLIVEAASVHLVLMIAVAFAFGYLIGMGLPVAPTYIVLAVIVTPFMIRAGVDPWVAHFFAFFVAVFGELSPPTSVTAAVASRIAGASFMRTMFAALGLCLPLLVMTFAVFTRPALVTAPGLAQVAAFVLVGGGTLALIAAVQADRLRHRWRVLLLALAVVALFVPLPWMAPSITG